MVVYITVGLTRGIIDCRINSGILDRSLQGEGI